MSFTDAMRRILPEQNYIIGDETRRKEPHITGRFKLFREDSRRHGGIDFNYVGGQAGINLEHPEVRSPVTGRV